MNYKNSNSFLSENLDVLALASTKSFSQNLPPSRIQNMCLRLWKSGHVYGNSTLDAKAAKLVSSLKNTVNLAKSDTCTNEEQFDLKMYLMNNHEMLEKAENAQKRCKSLENIFKNSIKRAFELESETEDRVTKNIKLITKAFNTNDPKSKPEPKSLQFQRQVIVKGAKCEPLQGSKKLCDSVIQASEDKPIMLSKLQKGKRRGEELKNSLQNGTQSQLQATGCAQTSSLNEAQLKTFSNCSQVTVRPSLNGAQVRSLVQNNAEQSQKQERLTNACQNISIPTNVQMQSQEQVALKNSPQARTLLNSARSGAQMQPTPKCEQSQVRPSLSNGAQARPLPPIQVQNQGQAISKHCLQSNGRPVMSNELINEAQKRSASSMQTSSGHGEAQLKKPLLDCTPSRAQARPSTQSAACHNEAQLKTLPLDCTKGVTKVTSNSVQAPVKSSPNCNQQGQERSTISPQSAISHVEAVKSSPQSRAATNSTQSKSSSVQAPVKSSPINQKGKEQSTTNLKNQSKSSPNGTQCSVALTSAQQIKSSANKLLSLSDPAIRSPPEANHFDLEDEIDQQFLNPDGSLDKIAIDDFAFKRSYDTDTSSIIQFCIPEIYGMGILQSLAKLREAESRKQ